MVKYSCKNCINFKTRLIVREDMRGISKIEIQHAIKKHDTESLGLPFPFNLTAYKRLNKYGGCKVLYCSESMFNRELYIYSDNLDLDNILPTRVPCPKYK